ncbi:hypothetical protein [Blastococcus sp. SYSU DS0619]
MTLDVAGLLRRVHEGTFGEDVEAVWDTEPGAPHVYRVPLSAKPDGHRRTVRLSAATTGYFEMTVPDLHIGTSLVEYDDEGYMEAILAALALLAQAYLRGGGRVDHRRGLLGTRTFLRITVDGKEWVLGRRRSIVHYPADPSA